MTLELFFIFYFEVLVTNFSWQFNYVSRTGYTNNQVHFVMKGKFTVIHKSALGVMLDSKR